MKLIQNLFNRYRHAPLTQKLLDYHVDLINHLQSDIYITALKENNTQQLKELQEMIIAMQTWTEIRTHNQPFNGKMKNFKLVIQNTIKYRKRHHKIKRVHNYHATRH